MRGTGSVTEGVPEPADDVFAFLSRVEEYDPQRRVFAYRPCTDDGNPSYAIWRWQIAPDGDDASRVTVGWDLHPETFWRRRVVGPDRPVGPAVARVELPGDEHLPYVGDSDAIVAEIEEFLTGARGVDADRVLATILFCDVVQSTDLVSDLGDRRWRDLLDAYYAMIRRQLERFAGREIKTTGDGLLATFDGPARAIRGAQAIRDGARQLGIDVRVGLHTGEVETMGDDIGGLAVHLGERVCAAAEPGEVLASRTVVDLVAGSGITFSDRGERELKGVPGRWQLYAVTP